MATEHESTAAQRHQELVPAPPHDLAGGALGPGAEHTVSPTSTVPSDEKTAAAAGDEKAVFTAAASADNDSGAGGLPTEEERRSLRHVGDPLPKSAFLVAVVELCERFTYYGASGLFQNYVQRPLDGSEGRGALGLGHKGATGLTTFFQFWCYVTPILGAVIADQYLGKYMTILIFCFVYISGLVILTLTALPQALHAGAGLGGFVTALIVIGLGTGGIKSNVSPLIADQYKRRQMVVKTDAATGERVIVDPAITIQRIYMVFYFSINLGSLSLIATPYLEKDVGFWSAFVLCLCVFVVGTTVLVLGRAVYIVRPPQGSIVSDAFRCVAIMLRTRSLDGPKPSVLAARAAGRPHARVPWDDGFVDEVQRALVACKVFAFYPIFWLVYNQFSSNFVTQAGEMQGHGIPNDLMQNFDAIAIIVFLPLLDRLVYPALRRARIPFPPINRIVAGFGVAALAMAYAAVIQFYIYRAAPCFAAPLCDASRVHGVRQGNNIHIATQTGAYMLIGISEILAAVTGLEYAYTKAPVRMKSFVQALYLLTNAVAAALGEALNPLLYDPAIQWMFVGLAVTAAAAAALIWLLFHPLNRIEDAMNALEPDYDDSYAPQSRSADGGERGRAR